MALWCVLIERRLTKRLLLEDEEDSVDELNVLEVVVDHVVSDQSLISSVSDTPFSQMHTTRQKFESRPTYRSEGRSAANRPEETVLEEKRNTVKKRMRQELQTNARDVTYTSSSINTRRRPEPRVR